MTEKGVVEAKSMEKKGIKIGEKWFNCSENVWKFAKDVEKGSEVEYDADDKNLKFIKAVKGLEAKTNGDGKTILRENVLRTAVMYVESQKEHNGPITVDKIIEIAKLFENYARGKQ